MQNLHITIFFKFSFPEYIGNVSGNDGLVLVKEQCHLALRKPYGFILQLYIKRHDIIFACIYYNW